MPRCLLWSLSLLALCLGAGGLSAFADDAPAAAPDTLVEGTPLHAGAPNVVGMTQQDALQALDDAGLSSNVVTIVSDKVGVVLHQDPPAGKDIHVGDELTIRVGIKPLVSTQVPNLVGMDEIELDGLAQTYFVEIRYVPGDAAKVGSVVAQDPVAGAPLPARGHLVVTIVRGNSIVPSVVGKTEAEALSLLANARLRSDVVHVEDASAADGSVLSQDPAAGAEALPLSTVSLRVAGHARDHGHDPVPDDPSQDGVEVPNLVGLSIEQAQAALHQRQLVPAPSFEDAQGAPAWTVLRQDTLVGSRVPAHTVVGFAVAKEAAPPTPLVQIPSVLGMKMDLAQAALFAAGLQPQKALRFVPNVDPRRVIEQYPPAGAAVPPGTGVTFVVPRAAIVPQLLGLTRAKAIAVLASAGFVHKSQQIGLGAGPTKVTWQKYPAGALLSRGSTVGFKFTILPLPQPLVHVPHVIGKTRTQAKVMLQAKGFQVQTIKIGGVGPMTEVVDQDPHGGSLRLKGSLVKIRYKRKGIGGVLAAVPNVLGKKRLQGKAIVQAAGFTVQLIKVGGGIGPTEIIDQDPNGGQIRPKGSVVKLRWRHKLGGGGGVAIIPNVIGKSRNQGRALVEAAGFQVQTHKVGGVGPLTEIVDTDPNPGTLRPKGSIVKIKYKRKSLLGGLKLVPNVLQKTRGQAKAALQAAGFQVQLIPVGGIGPKTKVISTNPPAGQLRPAGTVVQVRYKRVLGSIGGLTTKVPNLLGLSRAAAKAKLQARGLKWKFIGSPLLPKVKAQSRPAGSTVPKNTKITMVMGS